MSVCKVHGWGGLGSQLLTLLVVRRVTFRLPDRQILLVHHTSGVTRRTYELPYLPNFLIKQVDDFKVVDDYMRNKPFVSNYLIAVQKSIIKFILTKSRIVVEVNKDSDLLDIRPRTRRIFGTYSEVSIQKEELAFLLTWIIQPNSTKPSEQSNEIAIHYRYGDLPNVKKESIIPIDKLLSTINDIRRGRRVHIYSDSPTADIDALIPSHFSRSIDGIHNIGTIETIRECIKAEVFIGTNSKISYWIALFRLISYGSQITYMPIQLKKPLVAANKLFLEDERVCFYYA